MLMLVVCGICGCIDSTPTDVPQAADGGTGAEGAEIVWYSYEEGMKIAQEQKKPVMIDVYANWCTWCKELDRVIYVDSDVIEVADEFVCIKINADKERTLAARYNPQGGVPAVVFLRSDGTEVHRIGGYPRGGADAFLHEMMVALSKA